MALDTSRDEIVRQIDKIVRRGVNLTAWEIDFIESMQARVDRFGDKVSFSDRQEETIEDIYTNRVP